MDPLYLGLELGAAVLFITAAFVAVRRGRLPLLVLLSAAVFGILLEQGDQVIFETYEYSPGFLLAVDRAPVVIALTWAVILVGAIRITDALGVRGAYAPFVDALVATSLDLGFDAVAIRMGLWTWRGVGPADGWFGVPAGNFYAWLFVILGFSIFTRWVRHAAHVRPAREWLQLATPAPAFGLLLASIAVFAELKGRLDPAPGGGLGIFAVVLAAFVAAAVVGVARSPAREPEPGPQAIIELRLAFVVRLVIHVFFLAGLLVLGLHVREPMLLAVALGLLALELALAWFLEDRWARRGAPQTAGRRPYAAARTR